MPVESSNNAADTDSTHARSGESAYPRVGMPSRSAPGTKTRRNPHHCSVRLMAGCAATVEPMVTPVAAPTPANPEPPCEAHSGTSESIGA